MQHLVRAGTPAAGVGRDGEYQGARGLASRCAEALADRHAHKGREQHRARRQRRHLPPPAPIAAKSHPREGRAPSRYLQALHPSCNGCTSQPNRLVPVHNKSLLRLEIKYGNLISQWENSGAVFSPRRSLLACYHCPQAGAGATHLSEVEFDESTQTYQGQISVTVTDPATGTPIGALTVGVDAEALM